MARCTGKRRTGVLYCMRMIRRMISIGLILAIGLGGVLAGFSAASMAAPMIVAGSIAPDAPCKDCGPGPVGSKAAQCVATCLGSPPAVPATFAIEFVTSTKGVMVSHDQASRGRGSLPEPEPPRSPSLA